MGKADLSRDVDYSGIYLFLEKSESGLKYRYPLCSKKEQLL